MKPEESAGTLAITNDGGKTWNAGTLPGYRSAIAGGLATGPSGTNESKDLGQTWMKVAGEGYNAISGVWMVGANGRVATLVLPAPR
jgi:hypothetical protein